MSRARVCQLAIWLAVLSTVEGFLAFSGPDNTARVDISCGQVKGEWIDADQGYSFLGIPYAEPPVGNLRWKPPVALSTAHGNCWNGELDARSPGHGCFQPDMSNLSNAYGDEDCLYLNVWTPTLDVNTSLPVMVWIHGGSLLIGNGNRYDIGYAPSVKLANELNVVFVSMNYRLNAFGFMALELLAKQSPTGTSGNYGFMDQIEALRWVQGNVRQFGGDPNQVTVFGHSSGGTSIFALLASPLTENLFHKAWIQSASPVMNKTSTEAFKDNEVFLNNTGCGDVDCLYGLSGSQVLKAVPWMEYPYWAMDDLLSLPTKGRFDGALAVIDGYVLKKAPFEVWVEGQGRDVPVMIGSTAQETDFVPHLVENPALTLTQTYQQHVRASLSTFDDVITETALKLYPTDVLSPGYQINTMITDSRITCGTDYLALIASSSFTSDVYRYVITFTPSQPSTPFGITFKSRYSYHGIDINAFFGTFDTIGDPSSQRERRFQNSIRSEIMSFVKTGHPATKEWLSYPMATVVLSEVSNVTKGYHTSECNFWLKNGFFSYSWIN